MTIKTCADRLLNGHVSGHMMMMKVKEAEKKTEKDRALVKEGCGHIRCRDKGVHLKSKEKQVENM